MILQRLAEAIREQNWFTVVLEILIVVIGIFIGLQVDDWNTRRQEREILNSYLVRLEAETKYNIEGYQEYIASTRKFGDLLAAYHNHILDNDIPMPDLEALSTDLCRNGIMGTPDQDDSVLNEMVATGYLRLIADEQLVQSLRSYMALQASFMQAALLQAPALRNAYAKFEPYRQLQPLDDFNLGNCTYDFDALEENAKASSWVADAQRLHSWHIFSSKPVLDALHAIDRAFEGNP